PQPRRHSRTSRRAPKTEVGRKSQEHLGMAKANKQTSRNKSGAGQVEAGRIRIQWYRSTIGANSGQKQLVRSLGFTKLNQIVDRPDTPAMRGAVNKAPHLLRIVD